jgi:deoxyribodipyrimidine photo-lyase
MKGKWGQWFYVLVDFELLWRDFSLYVQKYQTKFSYMRIKAKKKTHNLWVTNYFHSGENGATPSDFINANMIELKQTFYEQRQAKCGELFCNELNMIWLELLILNLN